MSSLGSGTVAPIRTPTVTSTPLVYTVVSVGDRYLRVGLKLEGAGASGSVKDRTAAGLVHSLDEERTLTPGSVVVESTSGNLGVALARLLRDRGCHFIAVIDPITAPALRSALHAAGAQVVVVDRRDDAGGFLIQRLAVVADILRCHPEYRWPNQYENPANPAVHAMTTGPEIAAQVPGLGAVYLPVSTGGTLAGVSAHLRTNRPDVAVIAVDAQSSVALRQSSPCRRVLGGIGSSRRSSFLTPDSYDWAVHVPDAYAIAACRVVAADLNIRLGGSSGSVIAAVLTDVNTRWASEAAPQPVCLCADGGDRYADTVYSDRWLRDNRLGKPVRAAVEWFRGNDIRFFWE